MLKESCLDNATYKCVLRTLKITGAQNAKLRTKAKILSAKMVQRQFSVADALALVDYVEDGREGAPPFLASLQSTSVRVTKDIKGQEDFQWVRGDVPVFIKSEIIVGKPDICQDQVVCRTREPDFEASEYCRLLHVLADPRMTTARAQLMESRTRDELDSGNIDPWSDSISSLFNDVDFTPCPVEKLAGGVTRSDIMTINLRVRPYERQGGLLKRKFAEFKSLYGTCMSKYEASGQGGPEYFVCFTYGKTFLLYAFCFLNIHPVLAPLPTRGLQSDGQREEGAGSGIEPAEGQTSSGRKRKRDAQQINIVGIDSLS